MPQRRCERCGQENPEVARFCLACGAPFSARGPAPLEEERKVVTVLFVDLVGFTTRAERLDPEDVRAMLSPYYLRVRAELERFGGTVEKFIGDAVMALFGAPLAHEDDPERAVRAALAIRGAIAEMDAADPGLDLSLRIGVNTGEVLVVLNARPIEGEGMAAGDVVNAAQRIQTGAPVNGILVGEATYRATSHAIEYQETEPIRVKGKAEAVPVWIALAARPKAARHRAAGASLIGRGAELDALRAMWERVNARKRPGLVTLLGSAGVGKSRLLSEFTDRLDGAAAVHWGNCLPYGEGITYWPLTEIVNHAAGILVSDDPAVVAQKVRALLDAVATGDGDELRTISAALANIVGVPALAHGGRGPADLVQAELHWGIRRLLERLARDRPLVLVFEDLHWAEPTLLALLQFVLEGGAAPILLLATARPELAESAPPILTPAGDRRVIKIAPLGEAEGEALLRALVAEREIPAGAVAAVLAAAGGNPLFLEEMLRMLVESGQLERTTGDAPALSVPSSLRALIGARLDRLASPEKRTAQHASVVGAVFWSGAVASLDDAEKDVTSTLAALERRDMVQARDVSTVAGEREWAFRHSLIRDVAYDRLPKGRRALLHVRCADWIAALPAGESEYVEIVAYHLEQACLVAREVGRGLTPAPIARAADALTAAAEKAERRDGMREAERYYTRALELVGNEDLARAIGLRLHRGMVMRSLGQLRDAAALLSRVADEALTAGRPDLHCAALVALANVDAKQGRAAEARESLVQAESLAETIGQPALRIRAAFELTAVRAHFEGALDAAISTLQHEVRMAERIGDRALLIEGHLRLGTLLFNDGRLAEAELELTRCVELSAGSPGRRDEARASSLLGFVKYYRGDIDAAERLGLEAMAWFERTGDTFFQLQNLRKLALYALARGDAPLAERRLREALPIAVENRGPLLTEVYRLLTETLARQGRLASAREMAELARSSQPAEDASARAAVALADAIVGAAERDPQRARARFGAAIDLLAAQQLEVDLGDARLAFARALQELGDETGASVQLAAAGLIFARMGALGMVGEVERRRAEIAKGPVTPAPSRSSLDLV